MKLEIKGLVKRYGLQQAIAVENLDIACNTLVLIGPSGSGKSTLLRLLAGLCYPDSGEIHIDGSQIIFEEKELLKYRRTIGVVFQCWNLFPHLTALENIILPLHYVHHLTKEEAASISTDLLKRFDLSQHAHKKPYALSGGQAQRVALIRALAVKPKLLLFDEPTSALDPLMTAEVLEIIFELKKEKQNLILATHHLQFAKRIADHVLFISQGLILENGTVIEVFAKPKTLQAQEYMAKVLAY
ncbi:MAG: amino acid ABC transporter ATP-binding protein [Candidatus Protochlamydia sp.]|nr:amino acid ABC transporter ATP-binding protein [Candidatus Protochlamydia sp.]